MADGSSATAGQVYALMNTPNRNPTPTPTPTPEQVYALRFPPMPGRFCSLVAALSSRYSLEYASFEQDGARFGVAYKHPASAVPPVLRLSDFVLAASYYSPP